MQRWLALVGVAIGLAATLYAGLLVHRAYGINLPWETPKHLDICERRYDLIDDRDHDAPEANTLRLQPTIFRLPMPLPDLHPPDSGPYGGCPWVVILELRDTKLRYLPVQGGP